MTPAAVILYHCANHLLYDVIVDRDVTSRACQVQLSQRRTDLDQGRQQVDADWSGGAEVDGQSTKMYGFVTEVDQETVSDG